MAEYRSFHYAHGDPPGPADARRMFFLILPSGVFAATLIPFVMLSDLQVDTHDFGAVCIMLVMAPLAFGCGVRAIVDAVRKERGVFALLWGTLWNCLLVLGTSAAFYVCMRMHLV